jgi:hypothetical protein
VYRNCGLHTFLFNPFISKQTNLREIILNMKYPLHGRVDFLFVLLTSVNSEAVLIVRNILPLVAFHF